MAPKPTTQSRSGGLRIPSPFAQIRIAWSIFSLPSAAGGVLPNLHSSCQYHALANSCDIRPPCSDERARQPRHRGLPTPTPTTQKEVDERETLPRSGPTSSAARQCYMGAPEALVACASPSVSQSFIERVRVLGGLCRGRRPLVIGASLATAPVLPASSGSSPSPAV